jgi:hypothetical protein
MRTPAHAGGFAAIGAAMAGCLFCNEQATRPEPEIAVSVIAPACDTVIYGNSTFLVDLHIERPAPAAAIAFMVGNRRCVGSGLPDTADLDTGDTVLYAHILKDSLLTTGKTDFAETSWVYAMTDSARIVVNGVSSCGTRAGQNSGYFRIRPCVRITRPRGDETLFAGEQCTVLVYGKIPIALSLFWMNGKYSWTLTSKSMNLSRDSMLIFTIPSQIIRPSFGDTVSTISDTCWISATPYSSAEIYARTDAFKIRLSP